LKFLSDQKLRVASVFAMLVLLMSGATGYHLMTVFKESNLWLNQAHDVLANVQDLLLAVVTADSSSKEFALTGKDLYAESFATNLKRAEQDEAFLRGQKEDTPELQSQLAAIVALANANIKNAKTMIALRRDNHPVHSFAIGSADQGDFDKLLPNGDQLVAEELRLRTLHEAATKQKVSELSFFLTIGISLSIFVIGTVAWSAQHEISKHIDAANALRDSAKAVQILLNEFEDYAVFRLDSKGRVVGWNAGAERLKGYSAKEIIGQNFSVFFPQGDIAQRKPEEILRMASATGRFEESGVRVRKDGSEFIARVTDAALRDSAGILRGFSVSTHDLTANQESEARYRRLLEAAPDGIVVVNEAGEIALLNAQVERQFGYRRDELLGQKVTNIIPIGLADRLIAEGIRTATEVLGQQIGPAIELQGFRKDGTEFPIEIMLSPLQSPKGKLVTAGIRDITLRKDAERHLAQMEARYRGLLEAAPDGIVVVDPGGEIVLLNAQAEKQFGYHRDELLRQNIKDIIPEGFAERLIADALRTPTEALVQEIGALSELYGRRKDGTQFPIGIMLSQSETPEGVLVTAAIRDISERKQLELQLRQSQKMQAVGQLTGGIAHDFNNLLAVIIGNLGLLEILVSGDEAALKRVRSAQKAAARGTDIVRRLLVFSSVDEMKPTFVSLGDSIQNTIEMASRGLGLEIKFTTHLDQSLPPIFVDPAGLESALLNLVVNARDAMPKGGSIIVSSQLQNLVDSHPAIQAGDLKVGCYVCVSVTDTGEGMSPETLARACEPFFTTKPHNKGTGLGLAMVYGFVKHSGGTVRIYSQLGLGTTVTFYLPVVADPLHPVLADTKELFNTKLSGTVLVVDDELDILEIALAYLAEMGLTTHQAKDGASALAMIAQHMEIDLMITDIVMPGKMNGAELVQRARVLSPDLKIIYSSGAPAEALAEKSVLLLEGPLLCKPYQRSEFAAIVHGVMEGSQNKPPEPESTDSDRLHETEHPATA
jgi:PAS domain S-box-containing protein